MLYKLAESLGNRGTPDEHSHIDLIPKNNDALYVDLTCPQEWLCAAWRAGLTGEAALPGLISVAPIGQ